MTNLYGMPIGLMTIEDAKNLMLWMDEHDADIKRQTIDEFITRIEEDLYTFVDNDSWTSDGSLMWKCDEVREIAEQMKGEAE